MDTKIAFDSLLEKNVNELSRSVFGSDSTVKFDWFSLVAATVAHEMVLGENSKSGDVQEYAIQCEFITRDNFLRN